LADDVQEIAIKCGYRAKVASKKGGSCFNVIININRTESEISSENIKRIGVCDVPVFDVTVPEYHILLVRRNGKVCWSGNCYLNSACYLPHLPDDDIVILSNFTAEGRAGEEKEAGDLLYQFGYDTIKCPYRFEGDPELKFVRDDLYLGGHGIRTDAKAYDWISDEYGAKIIKIEEKDEKLYHLDCICFVIGKENVLLCTEIIDPKTVKEVEKVANVIPVSKVAAYEGICNSLLLEDVVYNASSLQYMKATDKDYETEQQKNNELQKICRELGKELLYFDLSECEKSGAMLSCFVMNLTHRDRR
jgi:N-dimethylarginine dimethylaminohydrolase